MWTHTNQFHLREAMLLCLLCVSGLRQIINRTAGEISSDVPIITNYLSVNISHKMPVRNGGRSLQDSIHTALLKWSLNTTMLVPVCNSQLHIACKVVPSHPKCAENFAHSPSCYITWQPTKQDATNSCVILKELRGVFKKRPNFFK